MPRSRTASQYCLPEHGRRMDVRQIDGHGELFHSRQICDSVAMNRMPPFIVAWALASLLILAGCVGSGEKRDAHSPRSGADEVTAGRLPSNSPQTRQCLTQLRRLGAAFEPLPDRRFGGGCTALSSVKLLDIGASFANLTAITCPMATNLIAWNRSIAQPAARRFLGADIARIDTMGSYSCRPVNGQAGNQLSEHGRANAIDIGGFTLADGRRISVLNDWNGRDNRVRQFLREVHRGACRNFQIVLGPDANHWHADHLHFDMGKGPYCR